MGVSGAGEIGFTEEIYYDADGDIASPTWVLMPGVQDVQENSTLNESEFAERNVNVIGVVPTHETYSVDVTISKRNGNTDFDALRAAYRGRTKIGLAVMSGAVATTGESGFQCEAYVTGWNNDGSHEGNNVTVTIKPAANPTTAAALVTISGG